jgi:4a-hydroxytetrahydrobiopterin dehydratase|tara:strand:+ start:529 stop:765 length:237 start_codon:yes stop_codon:yes gene_type:complete
MAETWQTLSGKLIKSFVFKDFKESLSFINAVGKISENLNHHPKIINEYNKVDIELWTHDKNEITDLDHKLAAKIDNLI